MTLLTHEEYQSIAASMALPTGAFIDGKSCASSSGRTFNTDNPATGLTLTQIASCEPADVDIAVEKGRDAFESGVWSKMHPSSRKKVLIKLTKLMRRNIHELAVLESLESGKPIYDIETIDIPEAIHCLEWHAEAVDKIYDQVAPTGDRSLAMIVREPVGVVACVLPWNFPILMLAWKIGPALAAGNSVIVKPAEHTSMTTIRIAELAHEAGVPRGIFQVLPGMGEIVGKAIGLHPDIDMVAFTGSTHVGRLFLEYSAHSNLKRIVLECGGKNPCIVLADAENLSSVAQHIVQAAFWNMGENCSANSRLIVDVKIKDKLIENILNVLKEWPMGDPLNPENRIGAIISKEHFETINIAIEKGVLEGAKLIHRQENKINQKGYFMGPVIFDNVTPEMALARDEIFGPVLAIISVTGAEQALKVANETSYGLAASLFTANIGKAHRMAKAIRAGTVSINCYSEGDITTPFGGYKQSGFGGRDKSLHAHDQYTELKTIWIDVSEDKLVNTME